MKTHHRRARGTHTIEIRALFDKHPLSTGYYFYFDYLWPLEPPQESSRPA
jgi:hypothetical protein